MKRLVVVSLVLTLMSVALIGCSAPAPKEVKVFAGQGQHIMFRSGPGRDAQDVPVYSFNYVTASATFDAAGKIIDVFVDILEVASPNYDGDGMPHFTGWPATEGYNTFDHSTKAISGKGDTSVASIAAEVNGWVTKRDRGEDYHMNPKNEWYKQMDYFQTFFKGKTVAEIETWFTKYASDRNGRPLDPNTTNEIDKAKVDKLSADEKKMLTDVRSGATMSLNDPHGNIIAAIKAAYENRYEVVIPIPAK